MDRGVRDLVAPLSTNRDRIHTCPNKTQTHSESFAFEAALAIRKAVHLRSEKVLDKCRSLVLDMASQLWWRFLNYHTRPFLLVKLTDAFTKDRAVTSAVAEDFMSSPHCCLDRDFSRTAEQPTCDCASALHSDSHWLQTSLVGGGRTQ